MPVSFGGRDQSVYQCLLGRSPFFSLTLYLHGFLLLRFWNVPKSKVSGRCRHFCCRYTKQISTHFRYLFALLLNDVYTLLLYLAESLFHFCKLAFAPIWPSWSSVSLAVFCLLACLSLTLWDVLFRLSIIAVIDALFHFHRFRTFMLPHSATTIYD